MNKDVEHAWASFKSVMNSLAGLCVATFVMFLIGSTSFTIISIVNYFFPTKPDPLITKCRAAGGERVSYSGRTRCVRIDEIILEKET